MARNLLTTAAIRNSDKSKLSDGDGLWLHRNRSGNRSWVFIYTRLGRRREMGLGPLGSGTGHVGLAAARAKADEIRTILGRGGDPFTEMGERSKATGKTFSQVVEAYIEVMAPSWRGAKTEASWRRFLSTYAKPLRKRVIADIATEDVLAVLRPLWHEKPETATKTRVRLKQVLDHAKVLGLRSGDNPAEWRGHLDKLLPPPQTVGRHHAAMAYADIPALMNKVRAATGVGARALEFTILTAARSGEARGATWAEIDFNAKLWTVPAERMKSRKEHRVPLADAAIGVLRTMLSQKRESMVFPGSDPSKGISDMTMAKALHAAGGTGVTVHGFRSTFRDWAAEETHHEREVAEAALAHAIGDRVERAYRRGDALEKRRKLMDEWAAYCGGNEYQH